MNKKIKKSIITFLAMGVIVTSSGLTSFADDSNDKSRLINSPSKFEYTTTRSTVTPSEALAIRNDVNYAKKQNSVSSYIKLSGTAMKAAGWKISGNITSTVGRMVKSDMNIKATESFAKKVIDSKKSRTGVFKLKRFFDGNRMHPWYYYSIS